MNSAPIIRASGLQTSHNLFSGVSPGALVTARNVFIASNHVVEPRRGHKPIFYALSNPDTGLSNSGTFFGTALIVHHDTGSLSLDDTVSEEFSTYAGTYEAPDDTISRLHFAEAKENLYFATSTGVYVLETTTGTIRAAGLPKPVISVEVNIAP